ncbi:hypothetical protein [Streptomyces sp. NBC_01304]|uniref:hypothetical protein n=1 Tax=Streptomyces sp. NBC_01304 TaxID=2903818 RepID=UPI002E0E1975|nr:hypothetical protein OG430_00720 [Streptomyces sp. NBC_01304]
MPYLPDTTAFAFPPFSTPYPPGVLRTLASTTPAVAAVLTEADRLLAGLGQQPVSPPLTSTTPAPARSRETEYVHNLVSATLVPYSLYLALDPRSRPSILLGHGAGFNVATLITGLMTLAETIDILITGFLEAQELSLEGGMLALGVPQGTARAMCRKVSEGGLHIGMINTVSQTVVCGLFDDLEKLERHARLNGVPCHRLGALLPLHTPLFTAAASRAIRKQQDRTVPAVWPPVYLTTVCRPLVESDTVHEMSVTIWTKPADLVESVTDLQENYGVNHFVEINATPTLTPMIIQNARPGTRVDGPAPGVTDAADLVALLNAA